jgi:hypothetical protein
MIAHQDNGGRRCDDRKRKVSGFLFERLSPMLDS